MLEIWDYLNDTWTPLETSLAVLGQLAREMKAKGVPRIFSSAPYYKGRM